MSTERFTSSFSHLLGTNFVPSTSNRNGIANVLVEPETDLANLTTDISNLEAQLSVLKQRHESLQCIITEYHRLLSPFRRLPDDMLREIFLWCLPTASNPVLVTSEAPLLLGRVCSRWRTISYNTPRLWASLHVPCPSPPHSTNVLPHLVDQYRQAWTDFENKLTAHCAAVEAWLVRSGTCRLSISFHPREVLPVQQDRYVKLYLDIILKFTKRWYDIGITVPAGVHSTSLASIQPEDLPLLSYLDLRFSRRTPHDKLWSSCGLLNAPRLRYLHIIFFPLAIQTLSITWTKLTALSIQETYFSSRHRTLSIADVHQLLSSCPNLVHCRLKIVDVAESTSPAEDITLPHLTSLILIDNAPGIESLFERLCLPSLKALSYHCSSAPSSGTQSPLIRLIYLTGCGDKLERLVTDMVNFTLEDLISLFTMTPNMGYVTHAASAMALSRDQSRSRSQLPMTPSCMKVLLNLLTPGYVEALGSSFGGDDMNLPVDSIFWPRLHTLELLVFLNIPDEDILSFITERMEASFATPTSASSSNVDASRQVVQLKRLKINFTTERSVPIQPSSPSTSLPVASTTPTSLPTFSPTAFPPILSIAPNIPPSSPYFDLIQRYASAPYHHLLKLDFVFPPPRHMTKGSFSARSGIVSNSYKIWVGPANISGLSEDEDGVWM